MPLLVAAHRFGLPYPTLLVVAGAAFAALPLAPRVDVDPKLALVLFVAPALLQSAYASNPREPWPDRASLFLLAIMAVVATTAAVAGLGHLAVGLPPWPRPWAWARVAPTLKGSLGFSPADVPVTFGIGLIADGIHLSPVLAVIAFGMPLSRRFTRWQPARDRVQSTAVWRTLVLASNATAFLPMGSQARGIWRP